MRPEGWESLLYHHILEARGKPFEWGTHDCVIWSADWLHKIKGEDPAAEWRGKYSTEKEAQALFASLGVADQSELPSKFLAEIPVAFAQRGDIMLHPSGMLGICDGAHAYFLTV